MGVMRHERSLRPLQVSDIPVIEPSCGPAYCTKRGTRLFEGVENSEGLGVNPDGVPTRIASRSGGMDKTGLAFTLQIAAPAGRV
jgi:hypothetical protein